MANNIPGWGGEPAKKSNITPKNKSKRVGPKQASLKGPTANNKFRSLAVRRNATLRNRLNKVRGLTRSNKSGNLRAFAAAAAAAANGVGLNLSRGGGGGGGAAYRPIGESAGFFFEPPPVKPVAMRPQPNPVFQPAAPAAAAPAAAAPAAAPFAFMPHPAFPPAAAAPAPFPHPLPLPERRGMGFNMANLKYALRNVGPAAAGGGGGRPERNRKTRKN